MRNLAALAAIGLVAALLASPVIAASEAELNARIDQVLGKSSLYETMLKAFQQAVVTGNKADVAAFVRYPIKVTINGRKTTIGSARQFIGLYDAIMTPDIVNAVKTQKYEELFVNSQGIMFGAGQVWIDGICHDRHCSVFVPEVVTIQHGDVD